MGAHLKELLSQPDARLLGMFVKLPTLETMEILATAGCDFVIIDMEHAPLSVEVVYGMIVASERSGMAAIVRLRGHEPARCLSVQQRLARHLSLTGAWVVGDRTQHQALDQAMAAAGCSSRRLTSASHLAIRIRPH